MKPSTPSPHTGPNVTRRPNTHVALFSANPVRLDCGQTGWYDPEMLGRLRRLIEEPSPAKTVGESQDARNLAVVALLFHAASLDGEIDPQEEQTIAKLVAKRFELSPTDLATLLEDARAAEAESQQILRFTRDIKEHCSHEERVAMIEMLWEVVFADGEEHAFESNLIRRVAGLIYVADQESGSARQRVRGRLGLT
jgi:uncharacterized tellurite resistance protein B-like protein